MTRDELIALVHAARVEFYGPDTIFASPALTAPDDLLVPAAADDPALDATRGWAGADLDAGQGTWPPRGRPASPRLTSAAAGDAVPGASPAHSFARQPSPSHPQGAKP